jgi:hypothetical protein
MGSGVKDHFLLKETTQREMLSLQAEKKTFPKVKFGYGVRVGANDFGNYLFHNGWYPGYKCMLIRYTDDDITAIVMSNNESQSDFIADGLVGIALNRKISMPYIHKENTLNVDLAKYTGKYLMPWALPPYMASFPAEIVTKNSGLYIHTIRGAEIELKPESATKFFYNDGSDQQIEFETDAGGKPIKASYTGWGIKREMQRQE